LALLPKLRDSPAFHGDPVEFLQLFSIAKTLEFLRKFSGSLIAEAHPQHLQNGLS
jgi:hypothetical protein